MITLSNGEIDMCKALANLMVLEAWMRPRVLDSEDAARLSLEGIKLYVASEEDAPVSRH